MKLTNHYFRLSIVPCKINYKRFKKANKIGIISNLKKNKLLLQNSIIINILLHSLFFLSLL
jgi:hypothetical protein